MIEIPNGKKFRIRTRFGIWILTFEFVSDFDIRNSNFGSSRHDAWMPYLAHPEVSPPARRVTLRALRRA